MPGLPSNTIPVDSAEACGLGEGAACCAFLTMTGGVGFTCEASSSLAPHIRQRVEAGTMTSRYLPEVDAPACHEERPR